jgi:hypothetical protein
MRCVPQTIRCPPLCKISGSHTSNLRVTVITLVISSSSHLTLHARDIIQTVFLTSFCCYVITLVGYLFLYNRLIWAYDFLSPFHRISAAVASIKFSYLGIPSLRSYSLIPRSRTQTSVLKFTMAVSNNMDKRQGSPVKNGKVFYVHNLLSTIPWRYMGDVEFHHSCHRQVEWSASHPDCFVPRGKILQYLFEKRLGEPQSGPGRSRREKNPASAGIRTPVVHPLAQRSTE